MNSKFLLLSSAVFLGIFGIALSIFPAETAAYAGIDMGPVSVVSLQLLGAALLGFALLNWMSRNSIIGGIYGKPLLIANLVHFLMGSLALIKMVKDVDKHFGVMVILTVIYSLLTIGFVAAFVINPKQK